MKKIIEFKDGVIYFRGHKVGSPSFYAKQIFGDGKRFVSCLDGKFEIDVTEGGYWYFWKTIDCNENQITLQKSSPEWYAGVVCIKGLKLLFPNINFGKKYHINITKIG